MYSVWRGNIFMNLLRCCCVTQRKNKFLMNYFSNFKIYVKMLTCLCNLQVINCIFYAHLLEITHFVATADIFNVTFSMY